MASEKLIQTTIEQCVGEQMCQRLKQLANSARNRPHLISAHRQGENENYKIAQYSAKSLELLSAKIAQFPKGVGSSGRTIHQRGNIRSSWAAE